MNVAINIVRLFKTVYKRVLLCIKLGIFSRVHFLLCLLWCTGVYIMAVSMNDFCLHHGNIVSLSLYFKVLPVLIFYLLFVILFLIHFVSFEILYFILISIIRLKSNRICSLENDVMKSTKHL